MHGLIDIAAVPTKSCRARAETMSAVCNLSAVPLQSWYKLEGRHIARVMSRSMQLHPGEPIRIMCGAKEGMQGRPGGEFIEQNDANDGQRVLGTDQFSIRLLDWFIPIETPG